MDLKKKFGSWEQAVVWLRNQPSKIDLILGAYYDDPLLNSADRYWKSDEWHSIQIFLHGVSGNALDVGAGRGIASYALAKDGFQVTALEPDASNIVGAGAIRNLSLDSKLSIKVVEEFSERLPFENCTFDIVFARAVLHHTSNLQTACAEILRVLKPGGIFIAAREHVLSKQTDLDSFLASHPLHSLYGGENAFLLSQYVDALIKAGFDIKNVLGPLESAINYAPRTKAELVSEISKRITKKIPGLAKFANAILSNLLIWGIVSRIASRLDSRPGRLYTFVATRPMS